MQQEAELYKKALGELQPQRPGEQGGQAEPWSSRIQLQTFRTGLQNSEFGNRVCNSRCPLTVVGTKFLCESKA